MATRQLNRERCHTTLQPLPLHFGGALGVGPVSIGSAQYQLVLISADQVVLCFASGSFFCAPGLRLLRFTVVSGFIAGSRVCSQLAITPV